MANQTVMSETQEAAELRPLVADSLPSEAIHEYVAYDGAEAPLADQATETVTPFALGHMVSAPELPQGGGPPAEMSGLSCTEAATYYFGAPEPYSYLAWFYDDGK